jgi:cytidylate kinase
MQLICISRGSYEYGKHVAERLAQKMGYSCVSREQITDEASDQGILVGKLEVEVLKSRPLSEEMAIQMDLFKSFVSMKLCEHALRESGTVYHGRTGHLVLPSIPHVLRVRTIAGTDFRVWMAVNRMNLNREKARTYVEQVEDDIRRWVRILYNENLEDPSLYDVTLNASHLSVENASTALLQFPKLPEFQVTPASVQAMNDLLLASRCRLALGEDDRTHRVKATVRAEKGKVLVTYLPQQIRAAVAIPSILSKVEGVESILCTAATTNILLIGERFDPRAEVFDHLIQLSEKWNAAIELVRIGGEDGDGIVPVPASLQPKPRPKREYDGGIMDDDEEPVRVESLDEDVSQTIDRLVQVGRAGGYRSVGRDTKELTAGFSGKADYSLVVVGDVYASKGGARQHLKRDLISMLSEKVRVPVIGMEELKARYLFGPRQLVSLFVFAGMSLLIYGLVFRFQEPILTFVSTGHFSGGFGARLAAAVVVAVVVPFVALSVGGLFHNLLKLIKME